MKGIKLWAVLGSLLTFLVAGSLVRTQLLRRTPPMPRGLWVSRDYKLEFQTNAGVCEVKGLDAAAVRFHFDSPGRWTEQRLEDRYPRTLKWDRGRWILMVTESHAVVRAYPLKPQEVK